jgi:flagellar hook-length control protein FliK
MPAPSPAANALPTMTLVQEIGFANAAPLQASFSQSGAIRLTSLPAGTRDFEALAVRVAQHAVAGDSRFDIRLDPPELGGIEVRLDVDRSGQVQAQLTAERPQTLDLLQRDAAALERALKEAGLDLGRDLSFSLKGDGRQGFERDADSRRAPAAHRDERTMPAPIAAAALSQRYYGADTRLDITV